MNAMTMIGTVVGRSDCLVDVLVQDVQDIIQVPVMDEREHPPAQRVKLMILPYTGIMTLTPIKYGMPEWVEPGTLTRLPFIGMFSHVPGREFCFIVPEDDRLIPYLRNGRLICHVNDMSDSAREVMEGMYPWDIDGRIAEFWLGHRNGDELCALYARNLGLYGNR